LQDDGTPDMTTNVIHGHVEGGSTTWDPDIADHEIPVSYYWACKPNFLGDRAWPLVGPDVTPSVDLPASDRITSGAVIAASYTRGCSDPSVGVDAGIRDDGGVGDGGGTTDPTSMHDAGPAASPTTDSSGCGCRAAGRDPREAGLWTALALLVLLLTRRRMRKVTRRDDGPRRVF